MSSGRFDVIVVGGGPSGLSTAYFLARAGLDVVVLEKGEELGDKNVFGGRIYSHVFDKYFPGWRDEAPVERWVRRERFTILCDENGLSLEYMVKPGRYDSFTAFLSRFLKWMGEYVESSGASIVTGYRVDKLLFSDGYMDGVEAGGERLNGDYIVIAEGANTILSEGYGLRGKPRPDWIAIGVKEVLRLGRDNINSIFGVDDGEGVAELFIGGPLADYGGGGFLYTMDEYVSIGGVVRLDKISGIDRNIMDLAEDIRLHPYFNRIIRGATLVEYSAHIVSEGGLGGYLDKPYGDGYLIVGDAAGTLVNTGFTIRGVDYAVESGRLAAETIIKAREMGLRDSKALSRYKMLLDEGFIGRSVRLFKDIPRILSNERMLRLYPEMLCRVFREIYSTDVESTPLNIALRDAMKGRVSTLRLILDLIKLSRMM